MPDEPGFYQLKVEATMTIARTGPFGVFDEEVVVEVYSDTVYVVPMAAPNVAEIILAYNDVAARYGERRSGGNFIQEVAHRMGSSPEDQSGTDFLGEANEEWCDDAGMYVSRAAYREAVFNWLKGRVQAEYGMDHPFFMPLADCFADWPLE